MTFIAKPFSPRELVLRVHNILRRLHRGGETGGRQSRGFTDESR